MVKIKKEILEKLKKRAKELGQDLDEYVNGLLEQIANRIEQESIQQGNDYKKNEDIIKKRLRNLGYIK